MCYYVSVKTNSRQLMQKLDAPFEREEEFTEFNLVSGFAHPKLPVLYVDKGIGNAKQIDLFTWGLIPFWVKSWPDAVNLRRQTLNARSEEIFEKPSFRNAVTNRCIIPVTGFFEWKHVMGVKKVKGVEQEVAVDKIPYYIHPKEHKYFYLAGLYSKWTDKEEQYTHSTFSILTGEANELMTSIHNSAKRQPLMIAEKDIDQWIYPGLGTHDIKELMHPCDDSRMAAHTIDKIAGNAKAVRDIPEIFNKVQYD